VAEMRGNDASHNAEGGWHDSARSSLTQSAEQPAPARGKRSDASLSPRTDGETGTPRGASDITSSAWQTHQTFERTWRFRHCIQQLCCRRISPGSQ
jgi:hypothetical protein